MMLSTLARSRRALIMDAVLFVMLFVLAAEVVAILPRALGAWQPWNYSNYVAMGRAHYIVHKPVTVAIALALLIVADYIFVAGVFLMRTPSMNCWIQNNDKSQ